VSNTPNTNVKHSKTFPFWRLRMTGRASIPGANAGRSRDVLFCRYAQSGTGVPRSKTLRAFDLHLVWFFPRLQKSRKRTFRSVGDVKAAESCQGAAPSQVRNGRRKTIHPASVGLLFFHFFLKNDLSLGRGGFRWSFFSKP
jgi:hypothetical protein